MATVGYKELDAYKKAYSVAVLIYKVTRKFPREELYGFSAQLRRAAVSVPSNIAEGYMRGSKEYIQFLKIALGSSAELDTQLSLSVDVGLCLERDIKDIQSLNMEVTKLLKTYIKSLMLKQK